MSNQVQLVRRAVASMNACSLLPGFTAAIHAQTVDAQSVLGDTTMPSP